jgi:hypothetical protein
MRNITNLYNKKTCNLIKLFILMAICFHISCQDENSNTFSCAYEKALISDKDFYEQAIDSGEPGIPLGYPFDFDTLVSMAQIEAFKSVLVENQSDGCHGFISLKYSYRKDTVYIPAIEYVSNNCHVIRSIRDRFDLFLRNDSCFIIDNSDCYEHVTEKAFSDSLSRLFSAYLEQIFKNWNQRKPFFNHADSVYRFKRGRSLAPVLRIELHDDSQVRNIRKYVDKAFDVYLQKVSEEIVVNYHTEFCQLSFLEFKLMSFGLFFKIELMEKRKPIIFIPPSID